MIANNWIKKTKTLTIKMMRFLKRILTTMRNFNLIIKDSIKNMPAKKRENFDNQKNIFTTLKI
jgi:hypothetical protein